MKNKLLVFFLSLQLLVGVSGLHAQGCNTPVAICTNSAFVFQPAGPAGLPPNLNVSNPTFGAPSGTNQGCQFNNAVNPQWLLLQVTASGTLGFSLGAPGPNQQAGLLHWTLYPYTPNTCANIVANTQTPIACNYNGSSVNGTGFGAYPGLPASASNYNVANYPVQAGDQFLLLVSNVNGTNTVISFSSTGTAQLGCSPFTVPSATACPNQVTTITPVWPGYSNLNFTVTPPSPAAPFTAAGPSFTVASANTQGYTVTTQGTSAYGALTRAIQYFTLTINPTATIAVSHYTDYCYGSDVIFTISPTPITQVFISGPAAAPVPAYSPTFLTVGPTTNTFMITNVQSPNANGVYNFSVNLGTGCSGTATVQINVAPNLFITMQNGLQEACQGNNLTLNANLTTAQNYTWSGPCLNNYVTNTGNIGNTSINNIQPNCAGMYTVASNIIYNTIQCPRTGTVNVGVVQTYSITVPPSYTICQGTPLTLSATAVNAGGYSWIGPNTYTSNVQYPTVTNSVLPVHGGNYVVTAYFSNGNNLSCTRTNTLTVNVVAINPVSVLVNTTICQYVDAPLVIIAAGASTYSWTGPNNFTATTQNATIPNIQPNATGTYTGMVTYVMGSVSCPAYGYNNITVVPVASITASNPNPVCQPASVQLLASALGAISYSWNGPGGFSASIPNPIIYYAPLSATGVYTVVTTYTAGGLLCSNSTTVFASINPVLSYTLPGFLRSCVGESLSVTGPAGATSYTWSSSSGLAIDSPNAKDLYFASLKEENSGIYTLDASLGPCITSKQVELQVFTAISFSLAQDSYTVCKGTPTDIYVGVKGGSENYGIDWFPESFLSSPTGSNVIATPLGTTIYNVTARDLACPSRTISHSIVFQVNKAPLPNINLINLAGCEPFYIDLYPGLTSDGTPAILTYDFGGIRKFQINSNQLNDSLSGPAYTYRGLDQPGSYTLNIYSKGENGCLDSATVPDPIVVYPKARSTIVWSPDAPSTTDNIVTFSSYSRSGATVVGYDWSFGGNGILPFDSIPVKNPERKYEEVGKYPVMLISTTDKGCVDTTISFLDIKDEMNIFIPNTFSPNNDGVNDFFMVKGLGFRTEGFTMEIYDRWGHLVYSTKDVTKGWDGSVKGGGTPEEGVYIYRIKAIGTNGEGRKEFDGHVTLIR